MKVLFDVNLPTELPDAALPNVLGGCDVMRAKGMWNPLSGVSVIGTRVLESK